MSMKDWIMGTTHVLLNEKNKAIVDGDKDVVKALKKMDKAIGALIEPFNGVARVPDNVAGEIEKLVKQNARSFTRVAATKLRTRDKSEALGDLLFGDKPVQHESIRWVEYENTYTSPNGNKIEQRLAMAPVGR